MPTVRHHDATIHYEESGQGFPIFTFAPAGLQSTIEVWSRPAAPLDPLTEFAGDFRVIAMDQRGFVSGVDRAFVSTCATPCLVLAGNDEAHPREWKTGAALASARARVKEFLAKHTPRA